MPRPMTRLVALTALGLAALANAGSDGFVNWESPQSHPLDLTPSGAVLLAVNTADGQLEIFDVVKGLPRRRGSVAVGLDPVSVRARSETEAWVVNQISDSVSVVDLPSMRVTRTILVGDEPADVVFAGSPERGFVSLARPSQLAVVDLAGKNPTVTTLAIAGASPRALATDPARTRVYLAIFESGNRTTVVPRASVTAASGPYGGQNPPPNSGNAFSPPRAPGQPPPPRVSQIVRKAGDGTWRDDNGRNWSSFITWDLHDHDLATIDANTLAITWTSGLMTTVSGLGVSPTGTLLAVGMESRNEIRFESNVNSRFVRVLGALLPGDGGLASVVDLNPHLTYASTSIPFLERLQSLGDPRGVAWHPTGERVFVAGLGSNSVGEFTAAGSRVAAIDVGEGPTGLAVSPDGARLFVLDRFEAAISTVDLASRVEIARLPFHDATPAAVKAGRPFLYDTHRTSGLGQASCASCHIDGRSDRLGWDLGDPQGAVQLFDEQCQAPAGGCIAWHPMKGPMTTQTLVGIIGNEPLHWRGEKSGLAEFNPAYVNLQGRDSEITAGEMASLETYLASLTFPPNPFRNLDGTLRAAVPTSLGIGSAIQGQGVFMNAPTLPGPPGGGALTCTACHPGSAGTNNRVDIPVGGEPQNRKNAPLRDVYRKVGANRASLAGDRGFGFDHHGEEFTIQDILAIGFQFMAGANGQAQRRNLEAFLLSFGTDTHAGVGAQVTARNGGGAGDDAPRINQLVAIAASDAAGLVVKGSVGGQPRGFAYANGSFIPDRADEAVLSPASLLALAEPGGELTYTLVPKGAEFRMGIDRDGDGFRDRDELDAGSDPADAASVPSCPADLDGNHAVGAPDLAILLARWGLGGTAAGGADLDGNGTVDSPDIGILLAEWGPCG